MLKEAKIKTKDEDSENKTQVTSQTDLSNLESSKTLSKSQKQKA